MDISKDSKIETNKLLQSIFIICDYLVETNSLNLLVFVIISIIEFIQNLYFFINPLFGTYWTNEYLFNKTTNFIKYFWIDQFFVSGDQFESFLIFFYLFIAIILLFALDIAYLLISLRKNYSIRLIPRVYLQLIINIFLPVLFIPMLSSFLSVFICYSTPGNSPPIVANEDDSNTAALRSLAIYNFFYPTTICFSGNYILHCVFGGCGIIVICSFGYLLSLIFYETNPKSWNIKSRFSSSFEKSFYVIKIAWVVIYQVSSYFHEERRWIIALTNFLFTLVPFCILISDKPYYNKTVQKILLIIRTIEFLTAIILVISLLIGETNFEGEWILFFIGIMLIIGIYFIFPDNKFDIIILNLESIKDENLFQKKLVYTFDLVENQDQMEFELFLKGYVMTNNSADTSNYLTTLRHKVETVAKTPSEKFKKHAEEYYIFQKYINECYKKGLKKFPQSNSLKLNYLLFSIRYLQNPQISMLILKQIEPRNLKFEELFIYYRYTKIIEERLIVHNPNAVKVDINFEITYKRNKNIFIKLIESTTQHLIDFWDVISRENIKFSTIEDLVYKINVNLETISIIWKEIQRLKTNDNKLISLYEKFLKNVLNDEQGCEELLSKYIDGQSGINNEENLLGDYESYIQDGSGYVIVSGNTESFGRILAFNVAMARIFNYTLEEMKSLNMNSLMPDIYREEHNSRLLSLIIADDSKDKSNKHFGQANSVGLSKNGYILPINNTMTILNGINDNINFLALIRLPPSDNFKPFPVYFVTDLNFDIHNVSSQAIPLFGINSNNICLKSTPHGKEYLNLTELIKELEPIRQDKALVDNYRSGIMVTPKKKIIIDNFDKVNQILNQAAESNKAVKLLNDNSIIKCDISEGPEYSHHKTIIPRFNRNYTQFYMSMSNAQIGMSNLGYIIKLDPIKEERFYFDDKSSIVYEDNILSFNPHDFTFYDPSKTEDILVDYHSNNKGDNLNQKMIIKQTNLFKRRKHQDVDTQGQAHANLLNYLFKKKNIKNYCEIGKVKTIIRVQGRPDKEILPTSVMKINETIKKLDELLKASKGKEINIFEEEKNEEQALLEKSTEDLLNFKGIEGWEVVYNKIKAAKIPREITILRIISVLVILIKLSAIIAFYVCHKANLDILSEISTIGNFSLFHAHYIIDSIHRSEMYIYYHSIKTPAGEEAFKAVNTTLVSNIQNIINITNSLRQTSNIDKLEYKIYQNRTFLLLNSEGINQKVEMNLIEVFIQLINKLIGMSFNNEETISIKENQIKSNFNLFFINANNVYIQSILDVLMNISMFYHQIINDVNAYLNNILFIALILLLICVSNTFYSLKIISLKRKIIDLFFTIPEKICWKYHSNCEFFSRFLIDGDSIPQEKEKADDYRHNNTVNNLTTNANINNNNDSEQKPFISKRSFHSSSIVNNSKSDIMKLISINLVLFLIDYSYYGFNTMAFQSKILYLKGIEQYITGLFLLKVSLNFYVINQRQLYNQSNTPILNMTNQDFQSAYYIENLKYYDSFLLMIYNNSIQLFKGNNSTSELNVFDILNKGICEYEQYVKVCEKIPVQMRGFDLILKSIFENFTTIYVDFATNAGTTPVMKFGEGEYNDLMEILLEYIGMVFNDFHQSIITMLNSYVANVKDTASISFGVYTALTICIFFLYWLFYQNRAIQDIIYSKTTLLLIHPNDVKDIRAIMDFLQKEVYKLNSNS